MDKHYDEYLNKMFYCFVTCSMLEKRENKRKWEEDEKKRVEEEKKRKERRKRLKTQLVEAILECQERQREREEAGEKEKDEVKERSGEEAWH